MGEKLSLTSWAPSLRPEALWRLAVDLDRERSSSSPPAWLAMTAVMVVSWLLLRPSLSAVGPTLRRMSLGRRMGVPAGLGVTQGRFGLYSASEEGGVPVVGEEGEEAVGDAEGLGGVEVGAAVDRGVEERAAVCSA